MSEWDDLKNKLMTPEQREAAAKGEADKRTQAERAEAARAVSEALAEIRQAFFNAQNAFARANSPFAPLVSVFQEGEDSKLQLPERFITAKRAGVDALIINDGKEDTKFLYRGDGTFAAGVVPVQLGEFDSFVAKMVKSLVP